MYALFKYTLYLSTFLIIRGKPMRRVCYIQNGTLVQYIAAAKINYSRYRS